MTRERSVKDTVEAPAAIELYSQAVLSDGSVGNSWLRRRLESLSAMAREALRSPNPFHV
jgi:hypothetical protein